MKKFLEPEITILNFEEELSLATIGTSPEGVQTVDGDGLDIGTKN